MKKAGIMTMLGIFGASIFAPVAATAGTEGRRNTAIALTAVSIYSLAKGKTTQGLLLGAGSYYAWRRYNSARHYQSSRRAYWSGYERGYNSGKYYAKKGYSKKHSSNRRWARR